MFVVCLLSFVVLYRYRIFTVLCSVAELKQLVEKPEVVEAWDVTAQDPRLLVHLKGTRNTVSVPRHWSNKRKYARLAHPLIHNPFLLLIITAADTFRASAASKRRRLRCPSSSLPLESHASERRTRRRRTKKQ